MHVLLTCQSVAANTKDKSGKMMLYHRLDRQATTTFPLLKRCSDVKLTRYNVYNIGKGHVNVVRN